MQELPLPELPLLMQPDMTQEDLIKLQSKYINQYKAYRAMETNDIYQFEKNATAAMNNQINNNDDDDDDDNKTTTTTTPAAVRPKSRDLTFEESLAVLPYNWYFDGSCYIDENGTAQVLHPNIQNMINYYLKMKNDDIVKYNKMIIEVKDVI